MAYSSGKEKKELNSIKNNGPGNRPSTTNVGLEAIVWVEKPFGFLSMGSLHHLLWMIYCLKEKEYVYTASSKSPLLLRLHWYRSSAPSPTG
jgi:hypothetical protein